MHSVCTRVSIVAHASAHAQCACVPCVLIESLWHGCICRTSYEEVSDSSMWVSGITAPWLYTLVTSQKPGNKRMLNDTYLSPRKTSHLVPDIHIHESNSVLQHIVQTSIVWRGSNWQFSPNNQDQEQCLDKTVTSLPYCVSSGMVVGATIGGPHTVLYM